jgi:predicted protein tyrosine phosphatase
MNILFVCTANMERSPTAEMVFRDVPGWVVRSAGTRSNAVVPVSRELADWADQIFVMENHHLETLLESCPTCLNKTTVLGVEDIYYRCSPRLIGVLIMKMSAHFPLDTWIKKKFICQTP